MLAFVVFDLVFHY